MLIKMYFSILHIFSITDYSEYTYCYISNRTL